MEIVAPHLRSGLRVLMGLPVSSQTRHSDRTARPRGGGQPSLCWKTAASPALGAARVQPAGPGATSAGC
jgi:hypothetical protein